MPKDSIEACLNVWCIVDEGTGFVYRIAARAYVLGCPDREKGEVLKKLASADFHLARDLQVLSKHGIRIIDDAGHERRVSGLFPSDVNAKFPRILDMVCKELEADFPERPVADVVSPRSYKMSFTAEPYYVLTFLLESARGELAPFNE